jgi:sulfate adenylyltransferase subunit 1
MSGVGLLRFSTAGSVDDGKSTLIGRLLYDSKALFEDQVAAVGRISRKRGFDGLDLALVTDGLIAEREQGITIDVAYRYFATPKRKFIVADTPGHEQYTRNMVTGASTADLAVILIDATKGVLTQSRRHAYLAALFRIPHVVIAVNKMDLVGYSQAVFQKLKEDFQAFCGSLNIRHHHFVPISALRGDMVVERGSHLPWYRGPSLLDLLETVPVEDHARGGPLRFPVQLASRPREPGELRGYMGRVESGSVVVGEPVTILPSGMHSHIRGIHLLQSQLACARAGQSVTLTLSDHLDIARGDMIVTFHDPPQVGKQLEAMLCWMDGEALSSGRKYLIKHTTRVVKALISAPHYRIDVNTLNRIETRTLGMNEIGRVSLKLQQPLVWDNYRENRATGAFILIDEASNNTVAAGIIGSCESQRIQQAA